MKLISILILTIFSCCAGQTNSNNESANYSFSNTKADSLFLYTDINEVTFRDIKNIDLSALKLVSDSLTEELKDFYDSDDRPLAAYYFGNFSWSSSYVVFISGLMEEELILVCPDNGSHKFIKLTLDRCSLTNQNEEFEQIFCQTKEAHFQNNSMKLIHKVTNTWNYDSYATVQLDSIVSHYNLKNSVLTIDKIDTVRLSKRKDFK